MKAIKIYITLYTKRVDFVGFESDHIVSRERYKGRTVTVEDHTHARYYVLDRKKYKELRQLKVRMKALLRSMKQIRR